MFVGRADGDWCSGEAMWKKSIFGSHYSRLLNIKKKLDPKGCLRVIAVLGRICEPACGDIFNLTFVYFYSVMRMYFLLLNLDKFPCDRVHNLARRRIWVSCMHLNLTLSKG